MSIVKIGLTVSLLLATGFAHSAVYNAHSAVYNLGDITNSSKGGAGEKYFFEDYNDFYYDNEYEYITVAETFTFSITEESRLSAFAFWSSFYVSTEDVSFSSIKIEEFVGEVTNVSGVWGATSMAVLNDVTAGDSVVLAAGNYALQLELGSSEPDALQFTDGYFYNITASSIASPVPEPSSIALMLGGLGLVGFMAARRKRA